MGGAKIEETRHYFAAVVTRTSLRRRETLQGSEVHLAVSIGIVTSEQCQASAEEVVCNADVAMYEAKRAGTTRRSDRFRRPSSWQLPRSLGSSWPSVSGTCLSQVSIAWQACTLAPNLVHRRPERRRDWAPPEGEHFAYVRPQYLTNAFADVRDASGYFAPLKNDKKPSFHEIRGLGGRILKELGREKRDTNAPKFLFFFGKNLERETRLELATSTLARLRSTN